ncbi:hypothetical protein GYMLUDRAFT_44650 [Collybiopsis luxurians FD-317 M1]|uniref:Uncharacterized protein n=1 Tax=Collybiopsis luxurians FD-317 M1 TaxID=944289 RepID=A0A0D0C9Y5_9AGAR|nr:hypothetical protein GYMLUDRAFT_44650 [Collybiopsis luxurians FD-317 M1]
MCHQRTLSPKPSAATGRHPLHEEAESDPCTQRTPTHTFGTSVPHINTPNNDLPVFSIPPTRRTRTCRRRHTPLQLSTRPQRPPRLPSLIRPT